MSHLTLDQLDPHQFEVLTYHLAGLLGYDGVEHRSGSGDRGRDIIAFFPATILGIRPFTRKVIFQCKRTKTLSKLIIQQELAKCLDEPIDTWILITTTHPTPALVDWVEAVRTSGHYPFHIETIWRNRLEQLVAEHAQSLIHKLPPELHPILGLPEVLQAQASANLADVCRKFHEVSARQIQQYSGGKYISDLYVDRTIDSTLELARSEKLIASQLRIVCRTKLMEIRDEIDRHLEAFDETLDENSIGTKLASFLRVHTNEADRLRHLRSVRSASATYLTNISDLLDEGSRVAASFSETEYYKRKDEYLKLDSILVQFSDLMNKMPMVSFSNKSLGDSNYYSHQSQIGIFSLFNFDGNLRALIAEFRGSIRESLRHASILIEPAGSGKTNAFCHTADKLVVDRPVLLFFGRQGVDGPKSMIRWMEDALADVLGISAGPPVDRLDMYLEQHGTFLLVLIDGINESRMLSELGGAIEQFLEWSSHHRIKVMISCRDIYAEFFEFIKTSPFLQSPIRNALGGFSPSEHRTALEKYFEHFGIHCELGPAAEEACQHPLLLRFFCEAHRSSDGKPVFIGKIPNIRLKNLFGLYLNRKTEAIRLAMNLYDGVAVEAFISALATAMLKHESSFLTLSQIEEATGDSNHNTELSLYLRVRDEYIIIAAEVGEDHKPRFSFIYEEFMEYLLARSVILRSNSTNRTSDSKGLFRTLREIAPRWANALGVGEFIAFMLLEGEYGSRRHEAIAFLTAFVADSTRWRNIFWNVIGKCTEDVLAPDLFDLIHLAIHSSSTVQAVENSLALLSRCSVEACSQVAGVLLWSAATPPVLRWTDLEMLRDGIDSANLARLLRRIGEAPPLYSRDGVSADLSYGLILDRVAPYLLTTKMDMIEKLLVTSDRPQRGIAGRESLLFLIAPAFPEYIPLLVNGLFVEDRAVRRRCAFALRECTFARADLSKIVGLRAKTEIDEPIRNVMSHTSQLLASPVAER